MNDVTRILSSVQHGDAKAADQLLPLVYAELRRLAAQRLSRELPGHTLQPTALVHEAYVRLVDAEHVQQWNSLPDTHKALELQQDNEWMWNTRAWAYKDLKQYQ